MVNSKPIFTDESQQASSPTVECLNSAFAADPNAIHALICSRIPCNKELADHPHIVVDTAVVLEGCYWQATMLGVINGVLTANGLPRVAVMLSEKTDQEGRSKLMGFVDYPPDLEAAKKAKPDGLPSIKDLWEIYSHLQLLRSEEASEVTFTAQNPDFNGQPNEVVGVTDLWTNWVERRFEGDTLLECLRDAVDARKAWYAEQEAKKANLFGKT